MIPRPPISTRLATRVPDPTLCRSIHFGVERDDEGLNQTRAGPVLPAGGREEVIEQPGRDNDHQNRVGPQLQPFAVATGHRLTSFSVDSRSLLAHRVVGALALLPEPLGALRIVEIGRAHV